MCSLHGVPDGISVKSGPKVVKIRHLPEEGHLLREALST
jgi:hypothetical protein